MVTESRKNNPASRFAVFAGMSFSVKYTVFQRKNVYALIFEDTLSIQKQV